MRAESSKRLVSGHRVKILLYRLFESKMEGKVCNKLKDKKCHLSTAGLYMWYL